MGLGNVPQLPKRHGSKLPSESLVLFFPVEGVRGVWFLLGNHTPETKHEEKVSVKMSTNWKRTNFL